MEFGSTWFPLLLLLAALALLAPAVPRVLRSRHALVSLAGWLAIAVALALLYSFAGPD